MGECFGSYSRYYDLLYRDKDYRAEARYVHNLICEHGGEGKRMLELGCGTGSHARHFADLGYSITAIDMSEEMIRQARENHADSGIIFEVCDVGSFSSHEKYDAIVSLFHVASYQISNERFERYLNTVAHHLNEDGVFIFDFWYGPAVLTEKPSVRVKRAEDQDLRVLRTAEPEVNTLENSVTVHYEVLIEDKCTGRLDRVNEEHHMRYFFIPELTFFLRKSGLEPVKWGEWMTGAAPSANTWGVCCVCQAL